MITKMVYPISKHFFGPILGNYIKVVNGIENIPKDKGFIIAANHASYMDHLIISSFFICYSNKYIHFLSKTETLMKGLFLLY